MDAIRDVEALIRRVSRAFYTDEIVLIMDVMISDKYIREDEMAKRLSMSAKQARSILQYLMNSEKLVKNETLTSYDGDDEKKKQVVYWYIDLEEFAKVISLRIHMLQEGVRQKSVTARETIIFECQRCRRQYTELEAVRYNFHCEQRLCQGEGDASLIQVRSNDSSEAKRIKSLLQKIEAQLGIDDGRPTIIELLNRLENKPLPRNLPSRNRASGLGGGGGALFAGQSLNNVSLDEKDDAGFSLFRLNAQGMRVQVILEEDDDVNDDNEDQQQDLDTKQLETSKNKQKTKNQIGPKPLPHFIAFANHQPQTTVAMDTHSSEEDNIDWIDGCDDEDDDDIMHDVAAAVARGPSPLPNQQTISHQNQSFPTQSSVQAPTTLTARNGTGWIPSPNLSSSITTQTRPAISPVRNGENNKPAAAPPHVHFSFNGSSATSAQKKKATPIKFQLRPPSR